MSIQQIKGLDFIEDVSKANSILAFLQALRNSVIDSPEYKLLYGKTQMFYDDSGRSRGEHSANIGKTSASMAKKAFRKIFGDKINENKELYIINERITQLCGEIMGLSHDLGHTPFGHDGENVLDSKFKELTGKDKNLRNKIEQKREIDFDGVTIHISEELVKKKGLNTRSPKYEEFQQKGRKEIGFEHNEDSAQKFSKIFDNLVEELRKNAKTNSVFYKVFQGSQQVDKSVFMEAILAHSRSRFPGLPQNFLSQIVRQADKIEYMNYDFEEFSRMGCFPLEEGMEGHDEFIKKLKERCKSNREGVEDLNPQEVLEYLKLSGDERRNLIEDQIIQEALDEKGKIDDNMKAMRMAKICASFKDDVLFYVDENGKQGLITGNNVERQELLIDRVIDYYINNPDQIPTDKVVTPITPLNKEEIPEQSVVAFDPETLDLTNTYEKVKSYISSLTNEQMERQYNILVKERIDKGKGFGVDPISKKEIDDKKRENIGKSKEISYLSQDIKDRIRRNRELHEEQVNKDEVLYQEMLKNDKSKVFNEVKSVEDVAESKDITDSLNYNIDRNSSEVHENNITNSLANINFFTKAKVAILKAREMILKKTKETKDRITNWLNSKSNKIKEEHPVENNSPTYKELPRTIDQYNLKPEDLAPITTISKAEKADQLSYQEQNTSEQDEGPEI